MGGVEDVVVGAGGGRGVVDGGSCGAWCEDVVGG